MKVLKQRNFVAEFIERMSVLSVKQRSSVSEPLFRGLKGNVCDSSLARWIAPTRLPICYFPIALTAKALRAKYLEMVFVEGVGHFEDYILSLPPISKPIHR